MGSVVVVIVLPHAYSLAHLVKCFEDVSIEQFAADAAIESFYIGVLSGFSGLDKGKCDVVIFAPFIEPVTDKLWTIVDTDYVGEPAGFFQLFKHMDHAKRW